MIREFDGMASDLDRQIKAEEDRTGVRDPAHFAYSTFAKSASQRRDNLRASADGLKAKLEAALRERDEALEQVARADSPRWPGPDPQPPPRRAHRDRRPALITIDEFGPGSQQKLRSRFCF